uniref:CMP/dCMP-type deaminase domain-containing protein n=1 Tax=Salmo trutta TaxID=8032 RepID=A0A674CGX2_SALTR
TMTIYIEYICLSTDTLDYQAASSSPDCPQCPQHILTGAEAAVSYSQFCETFGFHMGPSGARALLLFYELWGPSGTLVQRCQASNCLAQGQHPEPLLFDHQGYLSSVLEVCEEVLYCNYMPCQECSQTLISFLLRYPWVPWTCSSPSSTTQPPARPTVWTTSLAALTLSPNSGAAWGHLLSYYRHRPCLLDLPLRTYTEPVERTHTPQALNLLPPPHLNTSMHISTPHPRVVNAPSQPIFTLSMWSDMSGCLHLGGANPNLLPLPLGFSPSCSLCGRLGIWWR